MPRFRESMAVSQKDRDLHHHLVVAAHALEQALDVCRLEIRDTRRASLPVSGQLSETYSKASRMLRAQQTIRNLDRILVQIHSIGHLKADEDPNASEDALNDAARQRHKVQREEKRLAHQHAQDQAKEAARGARVEVEVETEDGEEQQS